MALPREGNECASREVWIRRPSSTPDLGSAVLRWYTLKYVWSTVGPLGATCDGRRNPFTAQDTVILERGGAAAAAWTSEEIDLKAEFRKHFESGEPQRRRPELHWHRHHERRRPNAQR